MKLWIMPRRLLEMNGYFYIPLPPEIVLALGAEKKDSLTVEGPITCNDSNREYVKVYFNKEDK